VLTVTFDLETANADAMFTGQHEGPFCRLAGFKIDNGPVFVTADMRELLAVLGVAGVIQGHNILGFDLLALAWHHGADFAALAAKAHDTDPLSREHTPPRSREHGSADEYDLDHVAERLGVEGKLAGKLGELKRRHGGYDKIPVDDPDYVAYLKQDVESAYQVAQLLPMTPYGRREHRLATLAGHMTLTGFPVDLALLEQRIEQGEARKQGALAELSEQHAIPLGETVLRGRAPNKTEHWKPFKSPLATRAGKDALITAFWKLGAMHFPTVDKVQITHPVAGYPVRDIAAGREGMEKMVRHYGEPVERLCELVTIVTTTRTVYQTALDNLAPDCRVHPVVSMRQASGRWSVTKPGMTVYGKHAGRHVERDIFIAPPGHVVLSCDLAQVDMRAIAGHCQDPGYMALFAPGRDAHAEIAKMLGISRQEAKARGHGWNYGLSANRMIREGAAPDVVWAFVNGMQERFPQLCAWRDGVRALGSSGQLLDNGFGRKMRCDPNSAYTVAPALMGQGTARDITCESLLRLIERHPEYVQYLVGHAHDEFLFTVPEDQAETIGEQIRAAFTWEWRGVPILCDLSGPGRSWGEVSAK
jgi:DNA polymerase-1